MVAVFDIENMRLTRIVRVMDNKDSEVQFLGVILSK